MFQENQSRNRFIASAAVIAAVYAVLTITLSWLSYGPVQFRVAEALTVLPFLTPAAIPGLFVGCVIANFFSPVPVTLVDVAVGSFATLLAAFLTSRMPNRWLAPIPPILCNAVLVGAELSFMYKLPLWGTVLSVGAGEAVVCLAGGYLLLAALQPVLKTLSVRLHVPLYPERLGPSGNKEPHNILR